MNAGRLQVNREFAKRLSELELTDTFLLLDCMQETRFWIKVTVGRYLRVNQPLLEE